MSRLKLRSESRGERPACERRASIDLLRLLCAQHDRLLRLDILPDLDGNSFATKGRAWVRLRISYPTSAAESVGLRYTKRFACEPMKHHVVPAKLLSRFIRGKSKEAIRKIWRMKASQAVPVEGSCYFCS